jgi:hypothetical protein
MPSANAEQHWSAAETLHADLKAAAKRTQTVTRGEVAAHERARRSRQAEVDTHVPALSERLARVGLGGSAQPHPALE